MYLFVFLFHSTFYCVLYCANIKLKYQREMCGSRVILKKEFMKCQDMFVLWQSGDSVVELQTLVAKFHT
jgi:hypothetical protein